MGIKVLATGLLLACFVVPAGARTVVDITKFGGVADGRTDNAPAFRRAMAAVVEAGGGRLVFPRAPLPYLVADTLLVESSHVEILGEGAMVKLAHGASDGRRTHVLHIRGTEEEPLRQVTVRGLAVDANYWAQENAARPRGIQIEWAHEVCIERVRIVRPWVGLTFGRGTVDSVARDCEVNLWHNDAYSVDGGGYTGSTRRIRLIRCRAVSSLNEADGGQPGRRDNAFEIEDGCQDVELIDCLVAQAGGNAFGIRNHGQPRAVVTRRIVLTRCVARNIPSGLLASSRGGENQVADLRLVDCELFPGVRIRGVGGEIQIEGGRFGELSFDYPLREEASEEAAPFEGTRVQDALVQRLTANLEGAATGTLQIEGTVVLDSFQVDGNGATVRDSQLP